MLRFGLVIAILGCALTACSAMRWEKPGADPAAVETDFRECRQAGYLAAARHAWFYPPFFFPGADRLGRPGFSPPFRDQADLFYLEQSHFESCMREHGYTLVPSDPAGRNAGTDR